MAKKDNKLYKDYIKKYQPEIKKEMKFTSIMQVPKLEKIVINMGLGKGINDKKVISDGQEELSKIAGQHAIITTAKVSNSSFKIREGMPIGVKVTLRNENMYEFLYKLINIALPRIRDFRGVSHKSFDHHGNYSLGINEYIIFPEINLDKVTSMKGMDITIVISQHDKEASYKLLAKLGMPFKNIKRRND